MVTSPNQRVVVCCNEAVQKGQKRPYLTMYRDNFEKASKEIKTLGAYKVWMYLQANQPGYTLGFSPKDVSDKMGISEDAARDGFNKLVELGFIERDEKQKNKFYCYSSKKQKIKELPVETKPFRDGNGEVRQLTFKQLEDMVGTELAKQYWED